MASLWKGHIVCLLGIALSSISSHEMLVSTANFNVVVLLFSTRWGYFHATIMLHRFRSHMASTQKN
jgi:hypothetical protein